jgi:hypothetical protein
MIHISTTAPTAHLLQASESRIYGTFTTLLLQVSASLTVIVTSGTLTYPLPANDSHLIKVDPCVPGPRSGVSGKRYRVYPATPQRATRVADLRADSGVAHLGRSAI